MKSPIYQAVVVTTIDGKIAKHSNHNVNWSSREDKKFLHQKIKESDVIIIGRKTFEVARTTLTKKEFLTRNYIVLTRSVKTTKRQNPQTIFLNPNSVRIDQFINKLGYQKICILGGTQIYSLMLTMGLMTDLFLTIEPLIFGQGQGIFDFVRENVKLKLISKKNLNQSGTILLHYRLIDQN